MGDFFLPPAGAPIPPPEPDAPPPNFQNIGANFGLGMASTGVLQGIWNGFVEAFSRAIAAVLGWIMGAAADIAVFVMNRFTAADEKAGSAYGPLVSATFQNLFGVSANASQVQGINNAQNRRQLGDAVGAYVMQQILQTPPASTGNGIPPSDTAPKQFLGNMTHMAIEGWLHSWIFDALTVHELEKFGDLKDVLARVLGVGRLSRQMFAAPIKIFVHDPYLALLHQKFRPKGLAEPEYIRQYFAGHFTRADLSTVLGNMGYSEQLIDLLIAEHRKYLSTAEIDYLLAHGTWQDSDAVAYLKQQGWDDATAGTVVAMLNDKRIDPYRRQMLTAAEEAFIKGNIPYDQLQTIAAASGLSTEEKNWMLKVAGMKKEFSIKRLTEAEIIKGIEDGILNLNDYRAFAIAHNMPLNEEQIKELEIQFALNHQAAAAAAKAATAKAKAQAQAAKVTAAAAKAATAKAQAADKGVTVAEAETLVKDGLWTFDKFSAFLAAKGYGAEAIAAIETLLHAKLASIADKQPGAATVRATAAAKGLNLAEVEKAVEQGILSISDLESYLSSHGFDAADTNVLVELTQHAIDDAAVKAAAKAAAGKVGAGKKITLVEIERAARLGITPITTYSDALTAAGFDHMSIDLLVGILKAQMAKDQSTSGKRTTGTTAAAARAISLAQLEAVIVAGIRPIADYTKELAAIGFSVADQHDLTELLQAKVDAAAAAAAARGAAGKTLAERGVSLPQAERAVKLGVLPIAKYQALLTAAGYGQSAVDVLTKSLLAEVAKTSKTQTAANTAAGTLAKRGISLPQIERAVIAGIESIDIYTQALESNGYSAADAATLSELVQLKLDQAERAKAAHADAEGKATEHGISLASEEAAVIAGARSMANYDALLTSLGYDEVDRVTLEGLLQTKVTAAQDKAAAKTGSTGTNPTPPV